MIFTLFHSLISFRSDHHNNCHFEMLLLVTFCYLKPICVWKGEQCVSASLFLYFSSHIYVIPAFTWTLSLGILLAQVIIQPITSLLTLLKGILLIITVSGPYQHIASGLHCISVCCSNGQISSCNFFVHHISMSQMYIPNCT